MEFLREISIDHKSPVSLYKQVYISFKDLIVDGKLKAGDKLPSTPSIAAALKVGTLTVDNALNLLVDEGFIFRRPRIGSFVQKRHGNSVSGEVSLTKQAVSSQILGVILCDIDKDDIYWENIIKGLEEKCAQKGYGLLYSRYAGDLNNPAIVNLTFHSDGIFICGKAAPDLVEFLQRKELPFCLIGDMNQKKEVSRGIDIVAYDNIAKTYVTTKHLLTLGHRSIAYVGGPFTRLHHLEMLEGYKKALAEFNIAFKEDLVFSIREHCISEGERIANKLLSKRNEISAAATSDDRIAVGIIRKADECGVKIPEEFSVAGCGNYEISRACAPALTTIKNSHSKTVNSAMQKLFRQIKGKSDSLCRTIISGNRLIVRASTGSPKKRIARKFMKEGIC
jgi:DNA-binding LacI/PurR family transcriptional regulator